MRTILFVLGLHMVPVAAVSGASLHLPTEPAAVIGDGPVLLRFEGEIQTARSFNDSYSDAGLLSILSSRAVTYRMEVDVGRDQSTTVNSAGWWNHFYSRLLGGSYMEGSVGSRLERESFTAFNSTHSGRSLGQVSGGNTVRIQSSKWVEDWQVGDRMSFQDLTIPLLGSGAVYYYGEVTLTSIEAIPEPGASTLVGLAVAGALIRRRRTRNRAPAGRSRSHKLS